jgi:leucyl aminopeptidase
MNFELKTLPSMRAAQHTTDVLAVVVTDLPTSATDPLGTLLVQAHRSGDFQGKPGQTLSMWKVPGFRASRLVLIGAGAGQPRQLRQALGAAAAAFKAAKARHGTVILPAGQESQAALAVQLVADGNYVYTATKPSAEASLLKTVVLGVSDVSAAKSAFNEGCARVAGMTLAREWGNRPANHATPSHLAKVAQSLGREKGIRCEVLGPSEVKRLGMGSFMAVAQGSEESLRFIVLQYRKPGGKNRQAPVVLVGKGITFDTGGISLKPGAGMDEMKFDMCGAASVLGTFKALADLQPDVSVVGLIPTCENMPDGRALKPGDVVTSMSGQTIEILNTDAEGRLILCDALTYAKRFKPQSVIDIATLTGACVIALGHHRSGLFASDDALAQALERAGEHAGDPCWRMPLDDEYAEGLKSNFADVANVGDRSAGSVTAAKFLQRFVGDMAWAHLDIAGTAWKSGAAKGATGRPVGLLLSYLLGLTAPSAVANRKAKAA